MGLIFKISNLIRIYIGKKTVFGGRKPKKRGVFIGLWLNTDFGVFLSLSLAILLKAPIKRCKVQNRGFLLNQAAILEKRGSKKGVQKG